MIPMPHNPMPKDPLPKSPMTPRTCIPKAQQLRSAAKSINDDQSIILNAATCVLLVIALGLAFVLYYSKAT